MAYQQDVNADSTGSRVTTFSDPLANEAGCARDIPLLQELGTNVIRVYAIDASLDHSACMRMLHEAGIYLLQDLSNPSSSIDRDEPAWDTELFASYTAVIDSLANYTNVLGFFAGNEVSNEANNTNASAFVKAAVRDVKTYIKAKKYRSIGVGYATNDDASIRTNLANYFNCGDPVDTIDFWGYNIYSWCGNSTYTLSGYDQRTTEFANFSVPAFFAEYGCNAVQPRQFTEVAAIYGPNMTDVWSGGIVYMYFQEANDYGISSIGLSRTEFELTGNTGLVSVSGSSASRLPDFTALSNQLALATPILISKDDYTPSNTIAQVCPATGADWAASSSLPPAVNPQLCSCLLSSLSCVASSSLTGEQIASLFSTICGIDHKACDGISTDATAGIYGPFSMCSAHIKLSFAVNQYYLNQNQVPTACDFKGNAKLQSPSGSPSCLALLSKAGFTAASPVTTATVTGHAKKSASGMLLAPRSGVGLLQLEVSLTIAGLAGVVLILL